MTGIQSFPPNAARLAALASIEVAALACAKRACDYRDTPSAETAQLYLVALRQAGRLADAHDLMVQMADKYGPLSDGDLGLLNCLAAMQGRGRDTLPTWQRSDGMQAGPFIVIDDFLPPEEAIYWRDLLIENEAACRDAGVGNRKLRANAMKSEEAERAKIGNTDPNLRVTLRYTPPKGPRRRAFKQLIQQNCLNWAKAMGIPAFDIGQIEISLNQLGHGGFFKVHSDGDGSQNPGVRQISYMLYLNQEPQKFTGGEFLLFDSNLSANEFDRKSYTRIKPYHNRLVVVPAEFFHAVAPVKLQPDVFAHGRMGLTGHVSVKDDRQE